MTTNRSPGDYDDYAATYAWSRTAVDWVLDPLKQLARAAPAGSNVLELGCGTGNYIRTLAGSVTGRTYTGLDRSRPMLEQARRSPERVGYVVADAARDLPFQHRTFTLAFAVDVVHHVDDLSRFFAEAARVLQPGGRLTIVTDSDPTLRRRSLTLHFPEILPIEQERYPAISILHDEAARAGFELLAHEHASGDVPLTDEFLARLEAKCSSAMRLLPPAEHAAGMARVRAAQVRGEAWHSVYDVLHYVRLPRVASLR